MLAIFTGMLQGAANPCYTEIFPKQVRASGASIVYGFGASLSGFSPLLCTILSGFLPATLSIALLTFVLCFIGLLVSLYLPDKQMEVRRLNDFTYMAYKKKQANVFKKVSTNVSFIN
jgi:MHS family proline/betaine transporter-like MFS transporter